jgi:hypothetical protein
MKARGPSALGLGAKVLQGFRAPEGQKGLWGEERKRGGDKSKGPTRSLREKGMKLKNKPPVLVPYRGPPRRGASPCKELCKQAKA